MPCKKPRGGWKKSSRRSRADPVPVSSRLSITEWAGCKLVYESEFVNDST